MVLRDVTFDVAIIGAGPAGLAVLSALNGKLSVCVIDAHSWLTEWRGRFAALDIKFLRSESSANPDVFHSGVSEFAMRTGRRLPEFKWRTGRTLPETGLPESRLFEEFCDYLSSSLAHEFVVGTVTSVERATGGYDLTLDTKKVVRARHVVFALGAPGPPNVPEPWKLGPRVVHSSDWRRLGLDCVSSRDAVLVIGGGLSAAQAALKAARKGAKVALCSRRPLATRRFDLPENWPKRGRARLFEFYGTPLAQRAAWVDRERGGGTVPPSYLRELAGVRRVVDVVSEVDATLRVTFHGATEPFDATRVVLATGTTRNCARIPLVRDLVRAFDLPVLDGLPLVDETLRWGHERFTVVGALATLQVGPDAANLTGARRAAEICADDLGVYDIVDEPPRRLPHSNNKFDVLLGDDDDDDDDDSEEGSS
ncbi:hypothetical protein CTAYLR_002533 [Chrysophaeum taylorii]|uniref:FAD/NAD(P)-binding domain-containing protein n=1 Tax=Chrysophaeum taylorii TaxID=2483200 RepID=A0AAD7XMG2_9STRA|nr:hypothetical protein CTAYLR_002533 [Chrysophaeum taylorii]